MKTEIIVAFIAFIPGIYAAVMVHMKNRIDKKYAAIEFLNKKIDEIKVVRQKFEPFNNGVTIDDAYHNGGKIATIILDRYDNAKKIFNYNYYLIGPQKRKGLMESMKNLDKKYFEIKNEAYTDGAEKQELLTSSLWKIINQKNDWVEELSESFSHELTSCSDNIRTLIS